MNAQSFRFHSYSFDRKERTAKFVYQTILESNRLEFVDTIHLPHGIPMTSISQETEDEMLKGLHLILGISYWKLHCVHQIDLGPHKLNPQQAEFWNTIYGIGLGEFYFVNKIDFPSSPLFESTPLYQPPSPTTKTNQQRALVGIGGGKDSIVSARLMEEHHKPYAAFVMENVGQRVSVKPVIQQLDVDALTVQRKLDDQLFTLSNVFKGHIPVSAIYAFIGTFAALLFDYSVVIVSNEHSANEGNIMYQGREINHQWSKSEYFEKLFQDYVSQSISTSVTYFSLLRPFTEYQIVNMFSRYEEFFPIFWSCNNNLRLRKEHNTSQLWCNSCPKCAFAFAMLAAFLPKEKLIDIFHENLFAKKQLETTFRQLLGIAEMKPLECVGTAKEVAFAFYQASLGGQYEGDHNMEVFNNEVMSGDYDWKQIEKEITAYYNSKCVPMYYQGILRSYATV